MGEAPSEYSRRPGRRPGVTWQARWKYFRVWSADTGAIPPRVQWDYLDEVQLEHERKKLKTFNQTHVGSLSLNRMGMGSGLMPRFIFSPHLYKPSNVAVIE